MSYILISYRPAAADYCRGCLMSETNAVFNSRQFQTEEELCAALAADEIKNKLADRDTGQISHIILIDGKWMYNGIGNDEDYPEPYDILNADDDADMERIWNRVREIKGLGLDAYNREQVRIAEIKRVEAEEQRKRQAAFDADVAALRVKHNLK